ncbi:MAG: 3-phosphoshikimate 1-carboxyvinyltransferase [Corallococcus sp.]|nr:3-phosphoshikimate 1-carboxyvinyltransferase [Corallococcus sp.]
MNCCKCKMRYVSGKFFIDGNASYGDKSITHRALIIASIADGKSVIRNASLCDDVLHTVDCLRALGAGIDFDGTTVIVEPIQTPIDGATLDCGNSATCARLLAGLVAGLGVSAKFVGDASLQKRPFRRVTDLLEQMGTTAEYCDGCLFVLRGNKLHGCDFAMTVPSAQVKSALLIAGLFASGTTSVTEITQTRNHTEIMLNYVGCPIVTENNKATVCCGRPRAFVFEVPNDISTAVYFVAVAMHSGSVLLKNVGINPTRTGAVDVWKRSGANIEFTDIREICGEKVCDIAVKKSTLVPLRLSANEVAKCIDEVPLLAMTALTACGTSVFDGVGELRVKECDRLQAIASAVRSVGKYAEICGDKLTVASDGILPREVYVKTHGDHRIAMCGAYLSVLTDGATLDDGNCVEISCPHFWDILGVKTTKLALIGSNISGSLSPHLMTEFAHIDKFDLDYCLCPLADDASDGELLQAARRYDGVNVTMPFKTRMARLLGSEGSINVVGKNFAVSTDGIAVIETLKHHGIDVDGKRLLIVGSGGAAESAVRALAGSGARLAIINRTEQRAVQLAQKYGTENLEDYDGVLSFIPACEYENTVDIRSARFVFSAVYKTRSNLIEHAEKAGIQAIDGLEMLIYQGAKAFELWTGKAINFDVASVARNIKRKAEFFSK